LQHSSPVLETVCIHTA